MKWLHARDDILQSQLKQQVDSLHREGVAPYEFEAGVNTVQNAKDFVAFFHSQVENGIAWLDPRFLSSSSARQYDDDESVRIKVTQALFLPFTELLKHRDNTYFK